MQKRPCPASSFSSRTLIDTVVYRSHLLRTGSTHNIETASLRQACVANILYPIVSTLDDSNVHPNLRVVSKQQQSIHPQYILHDLFIVRSQMCDDRHLPVAVIVTALKKPTMCYLPHGILVCALWSSLYDSRVSCPPPPSLIEAVIHMQVRLTSDS